MIMALALLSAAPDVAPEEAPPVQDIVVLNKMLDAVVFKWRGEKVDGKFRMVSCEIVRGSGDAKVDAITCKATEACLPVLETLRKQRRKPPFDECLTSTRKQMISDLFDARAQELAEESP